MKWCCFTIIFFAFFEKSFAQAQKKGILQLQSWASSLSVTKDENLFVATKAGEVTGARSINDSWKKINLFTEDKIFSPGITLDNANFFNSDTGFVSGFINNGKKYDIIYKTTDGGKTWKPTNFGQDGWVDDAVNLDNGEAWLSVAGSGIAYTADYGNTWKAFDIPVRKQRFAAIFFNTAHEGIIGSLWDMIAITKDNCKNWITIPTPLSQGKYKKTDLNSRPEIAKVAFYKDYVLCNQEGMVFYSKREYINWTYLPGYVDFYTDAENTALYFLDNKKHFIRSANNFSPAFISPVINESTNAVCRNGNLFIFCGGKLMEVKSDNSFISTITYTDQMEVETPTVFGYARMGTYGYFEKNIYVQKDYNGSWQLVHHLPFDTDSGRLSLIDEDYFCFSRYDDSIFYYSTLSKQVIKETKTGLLQKFCKSQVNQIIFEKGSSGCFHSYSNKLVYTLENGMYVMGESISKGTKHSNDIPEGPDEIGAASVELFMKKFPNTINQFSCIRDLGFTEQEYNQCKKDILLFQQLVENGVKRKNNKDLPFSMAENNIDFVRLTSLVDSIKIIDSVTLNYELLHLNEMLSTTSNWVSFKLINDKSDELVITNRYYESNAFQLPWIISLNGYTVVNANIAISKFINEIYPNFLDNKNKLEVLHTLVKRLY
jgi:hypothetical protein